MRAFKLKPLVIASMIATFGLGLATANAQDVVVADRSAADYTTLQPYKNSVAVRQMRVVVLDKNDIANLPTEELLSNIMSQHESIIMDLRGRQAYDTESFIRGAKRLAVKINQAPPQVKSRLKNVAMRGFSLYMDSQSKLDGNIASNARIVEATKNLVGALANNNVATNAGHASLTMGGDGIADLETARYAGNILGDAGSASVRLEGDGAKSGLAALYSGVGSGSTTSTTSMASGPSYDANAFVFSKIAAAGNLGKKYTMLYKGRAPNADTFAAIRKGVVAAGSIGPKTFYVSSYGADERGSAIGGSSIEALRGIADQVIKAGSDATNRGVFMVNGADVGGSLNMGSGTNRVIIPFHPSGNRWSGETHGFPVDPNNQGGGVIALGHGSIKNITQTASRTVNAANNTVTYTDTTSETFYRAQRPQSRHLLYEGNPVTSDLYSKQAQLPERTVPAAEFDENSVSATATAPAPAQLKMTMPGKDN